MDHHRKRPGITLHLTSIMKSLIPIIILALGSGIAHSKPPENYPPSRYADLYRASPFTDPPPPDEVIPEEKDLQDWTLTGVRKFVNSAVITVLNTKNQAERVTIPSKEAADLGFSIVEVKQDRNFLKSEVKLRKGKEEGWVSFDPKFLVARAVPTPAAAGNPAAPAQAPNGRPGTPPVPGATTNPPGAVPTVPGQANPQPNGSVPTPPATSGARPGRTTTNSRPSTGRTRYVPRPKK